MDLPNAARIRLAAPLREISQGPSIRTSHTLPVSTEIWATHADNVSRALEVLDRTLELVPSSISDFQGLSSWAQSLLEARVAVVSAMLALQPFEHFDQKLAEQTLRVIDASILDAAAYLEGGSQRPRLDASGELSVRWSWPMENSAEDPLARAFGLGGKTVRDEAGEFSPPRVFEPYYLHNGPLLALTIAHLASLGLPPVYDPLVGVCVVGWIAGADDPISAYCAMEALFSELCRLADREVTKTALTFLKQREQSRSQGRLMIGKFLHVISDDDMQTESLKLAAIYQKLVDGPISQYGWTLHCLHEEKWTDPPKGLSPVRAKIVSDGGRNSVMARSLIHVKLRNAIAHQEIHWDGLASQYVFEGHRLEREVVAAAGVQADAFARGCDAAVACFEAMAIVPAPTGFDPAETGRLSAWRRAEAQFGTNGLKFLGWQFNSTVVRVRLAELPHDRVNPSLQALLSCHRLLPQAERFDVFIADGSRPVLSIGADALARTYPLWERARNVFLSMPFSAFLPTNFDGRRRFEEPGQAARSICWIVVDDVLDAFYSSVAIWDARDRESVTRRIELAIFALDQTMTVDSNFPQVRAQTLRTTLEEILDFVHENGSPFERMVLEHQPSVQRLKHWLLNWGPVDRMPGVEESFADNGPDDQRAYLRQPEVENLLWTTM